jgi:hypothetical protein
MGWPHSKTPQTCAREKIIRRQQSLADTGFRGV